ncbi:ATP-binding response regulator [Campylobacter sputorum]|uniref:ATP-binding response regulator n=1 Tax=Campylobacter sputorum TaxID=206 RepID=UPI001E4D3FF5|nr:ATP-binding protein [Campylobacter sputorum]
MKNTFKIVTSIPLLVLAIIFSYFIYSTYEKLKQNDEMKTTLKEYSTLKQLKTAIVKEAQMGVLTLDKTNSFNVEIFTNQIQKTNRLIQYAYGENLSENINIFLTKTSKIRQNPKLDNFEHLYAPYLEIYRYLNKEILEKLTTLLNYNAPLNINSFINYIIFSQDIITTTNLQRDYINSILITNTPISKNQKQFWLEIAYANTNVNPFILMSTNSKAQMLNIDPNDELNDLFQICSELKLNILFEAQNAEFKTPYRKWTEKTDDKLSILYQYNDIAYQNISTQLQQYEEFLENDIKIYILMLVLCGVFFIELIISLNRRNQIMKYFRYTLDTLKQKGYLDEKINFKFNSKKNIQDAFLNIDKSIKNMAYSISSLKKANQIKTDLLVNIAHEIQAPLQGIISYIDLIEKRYKNVITKNIKENAKNIFQIAKNIKETKNIENNQVLIKNIDFLPIKEFENTAQIFVLLASDKNIEFYVFIDPKLSSYINGDLVKIKEILINLLDNAIKFTHDGGKVILRVIKMDCNVKNEVKIKFSVEDNGGNINIEKIDQIFIETSINKEEYEKKYLNLGLGISKKLATLLGGELIFKNNSKTGNTFDFIINLKDTNINVPLNQYSLKIAVIESKSEEFNKILEIYLRSLGVDCEFFSNVEKLKPQYFDFDIIFIRFDDYMELKIKFNKPIIISVNYYILNSVKEEDMNQNIFYIDEPIKLTYIDKTLQNIISMKKSNPNYIISNKIEKIDDKFNAKALVLTTDVTMQKLIKYMLSYLYIQTTIVTSIKELISEYTQLSYEVIFIQLDPTMQIDEHGIKSIIEFEKENAINHSPIIAITDNIIKRNDESIYGNGFDDLISQPLKINTLSRLLNKLIPQHKIIPNMQLRQAITAHYTKSSNVNKKDILIVKKSILDNNLMKNKFQEFFENIDVATNLDTFKKLIKEISYNVLIIDINLPKLNLDDIEKLLSNPDENANTHIKTVLMIDDKKSILEKHKNYFDNIIYNNTELNQISMIIRNLAKG